MTSRLAFLLLLLLLPADALAQDSHYITVFGSGTHPLRFKRTHTFATFTHVAQTPTGPVVENHTISWMPATLNIRPFAVRPETGVNLTQEESLRWAESVGIRTSAWGPYQISPERYAAYLGRKADLESGRMAYRAVGGFTKDAAVSNCGQSFSRAGINGDRFLHPTPFPGQQGTGGLVRRGRRTATEEGRALVERTDLLPLIVAPGFAVTHRQPGERVRRFER